MARYFIIDGWSFRYINEWIFWLMKNNPFKIGIIFNKMYDYRIDCFVVPVFNECRVTLYCRCGRFRIVTNVAQSESLVEACYIKLRFWGVLEQNGIGAVRKLIFFLFCIGTESLHKAVRTFWCLLRMLKYNITFRFLRLFLVCWQWSIYQLQYTESWNFKISKLYKILGKKRIKWHFCWLVSSTYVAKNVKMEWK